MWSAYEANGGLCTGSDFPLALSCLSCLGPTLKLPFDSDLMAVFHIHKCKGTGKDKPLQMCEVITTGKIPGSEFPYLFRLCTWESANTRRFPDHALLVLIQGF
jgi:hypothetical protein